MTGKRFIIGARVSTDGQAKHGVSLSHQLEAGQARVEELGGVVAGHCVESGVSGALYEGRAELQKALRQIERGEADGMVWYDLSRLSRDIGHLSSIERRVTLAGGVLVFCKTHYADNADGFLHKNIEGVFNVHQRLKTRELSMERRVSVVESGRQTQRSRPPFGFHIITRHDVVRETHSREQLGLYEIVPHEAEIVREIFERYASGDSIREICRVLQRRGVPTPKGARAGVQTTAEGEVLRGTNGTQWLPSTITSILKNECHYGQATFGKTRHVLDEGLLRAGHKRPYKTVKVPKSEWRYIACPAIVSRELWDACQRRRPEAKARLSGRNDRKYTLSGMLRCPRCHRTMVAARRSQPFKGEAEKRVTYGCKWSSPSRAISGEVCYGRHFWGDELEARVLEVVIEAVTRPDLLRAAWQRYHATQSERFSPSERARLERELAGVERKLQVAVGAQLEARAQGIDASLYEATLREASATRRDLQEQLARFAREEQPATSRRAVPESAFTDELAAQVRDVLCSAEVLPPVKQKLLSRLVESIYPLEEQTTRPRKNPHNDARHHPRRRQPPFTLRVAFRPGTFHPGQRAIWNDGAWTVQDAPETDKPLANEHPSYK